MHLQAASRGKPREPAGFESPTSTQETFHGRRIGKIREIQENLKARKDPAAKAQLDFVRKAEKLFMQGLSEAGGVIDANGKIHIANREDDELTRENSEKMHVSDAEGAENTAEAVDERRKVRYNRRTIADEKAGTDYLIHNFNGEVRYDSETMSLSDQELAVISHAVKTGWGKLNADNKCGYVFSSENYYAFLYNADNSITITSQFSVDIHQDLINIVKEVVENDTNAEGEIETAGIWPAFLRNAGTGYRDNVGNGVQQSQTGRSADSMAGITRGRDNGGNFGSGGADRQNSKVTFRRKGSKATLTVNGETLNSIGAPVYFDDAAQKRRAVWCFGPNRYCVENAQPDADVFYTTAEAAIDAENESLIKDYAKRNRMGVRSVKNALDADPELLSREAEGVVRRSRTTTGEVVTLSKGELAKLHANYAGEKVFARQSIITLPYLRTFFAFSPNFAHCLCASPQSARPPKGGLYLFIHCESKGILLCLSCISSPQAYNKAAGCIPFSMMIYKAYALIYL